MSTRLITASALLLAGWHLAHVAHADTEANAFVNFYDTQEWEGACQNGTSLSPIDVDLPATEPAPSEWQTVFAFPLVTSLKNKNTGHGTQLEWEEMLPGVTGEAASTTVAVTGDSISALLTGGESAGDIKRVKITPLQMHWHSPSEHAVDGLFYAAEGHIVSAVAQGEASEWGCDTFWETGDSADLLLDTCVAVVGVLYKLGETTEPTALSVLIADAPLVAEAVLPLNGTLDLMSFLPEDKSYVTYRGSLTTPDCNEGVRWHLLTEPMTITPAHQEMMQNNVFTTTLSQMADVEAGYRANYQFIQDLNDRTVYYVGDGEAAPTEMAAGPVSASMAG